jgi:hypothetical protein
MSDMLSHYKIFTSGDVLETIKGAVDNTTLKKYPFISQFLKELLDDFEIDVRIETYDDLVTYFEDDLDIEEYEDNHDFKLFKKELNHDRDIYMCSLFNTTEIRRMFIIALDNIKCCKVEEGPVEE